jgi:hypothetical protein
MITFVGHLNRRFTMKMTKTEELQCQIQMLKRVLHAMD